MGINAVEDRRQSSEKSAIPGNFAKIAKISLGLRNYFAGLAKFHNLSEIVYFARPKIFAKPLFLAKFCIFATHKNFAKLAKFR